jgi:hypothetical protein
MKTIKIEYWNAQYKGAKSELVRTEEWPDTDESFARFYDLNNQLKYCNGSHYKFVDDNVRERYSKEFFPKHHTISNYYKGGIVD